MSLLQIDSLYLIIYGYNWAKVFTSSTAEKPELSGVQPVIILNNEVEVDTALLILWDVGIGRLEFRQKRLLLHHLALALLVRSHRELTFVPNVLEEDLFLEYLAPLLNVRNLCLLDYRDPEWSKQLKLVALGMFDRPTIAVET